MFTHPSIHALNAAFPERRWMWIGDYCPIMTRIQLHTLINYLEYLLENIVD